jgi:hypothetical protein
MAILQAIYNSADEIPAAYKALFTERDGKFEFSGVDGIKTQADVDRLNEGLRKERNDHTATKNKLRPYEALGEYNDVAAKLDRIPELESSAGKIDETKLNQIVETRLTAKLAPVQREKDQLQVRVNELVQEQRVRKLHDSVRGACTGKIADSAIEDALLLAERVFDVKDDGSVATKEGVGCTPGIAPEAWLSEVLPKREHWLAASQGGGARGGKGGGIANNPWSKENWNLTAQGQYVREHGEEKAQAAAKAAGSHFGATAPAKS